MILDIGATYFHSLSSSMAHYAFFYNIFGGKVSLALKLLLISLDLPIYRLIPESILRVEWEKHKVVGYFQRSLERKKCVVISEEFVRRILCSEVEMSCCNEWGESTISGYMGCSERKYIGRQIAS